MPNVLPLPSKWLFVIKRKADGSIDKFKARIVAGGNRQREGLDFHETYAPVAKFVSIRILLTMAAIDNLEIEQCDIVIAFLYSDLDELMFMKPPTGISPLAGQEYSTSEGQVQLVSDNTKPLYWHLHKSLYGLRQSPRCFYKKLDSILANHGYKCVPADYGVWLAQHEVVLIVHVNDMQMIGTVPGIQRLRDVLESQFMTKCMRSFGSQLFLGLQLDRQRELKQITISQRSYAKQILNRFGMTEAHPLWTAGRRYPIRARPVWQEFHGRVPT